MDITFSEEEGTTINKKLALALPMLVLALFLVYQLYFNDLYSETPPYDGSVLNGPYEVERVVDGDTFIAWVEGDRTRVRMIGIDTPESVADNPERITEEGIIASDYTKQLLTGAKVYLEYDKDKYDKYDRLLAYVYIEDGDKLVFINKLLVDEGFAVGYIVKPNTRYADLLK
jgi:micrococcal nuclease